MMVFNFIEISCEYRFSNQAGGYSEVVFVEDTLSDLEIEGLVYDHLIARTRYAEISEDDYSWNHIVLTEFVKE